MDSNEGSGSMQFVLARKPYTITKQRERWTEQEHNLFLEALKLYGRAWQKIEEHIGTKTAVQIRSHAQKFFTKLEKEAVNKGVPIGQTHDIQIPPPRPKRKPSNPYPRKNSVGGPSQGRGEEGKQSIGGSQMGQEKHLLDLEKEPLLEISEGNGSLENVDEGQSHNSEVSNLLQAAQHTLWSLPNENTLNSAKPVNLRTFVDFVPSLRNSINKDETCKSILTSGDCKEHQRLESDRSSSSHSNANGKILEFMNEESPLDKRTANKGDHSENLGFSPSNEVQSTKNYPRHVPVHILDGSLGMSVENISEISHQESIHYQMGGHCANLSKSGNPSSLAASEHQSNVPKSPISQSYCNLLPIIPPIQNQDDYRAYDNVSSTFSSLIVTALLQNPAAHSAASIGSTFWPCATTKAPGDGTTMGEGYTSQHISPAPSMAALAGATVAAATAWWAANGLLPICAPFQASINCSATAASTTPMDTNPPAVKSDKREAIHDAGLLNQQQDPESSEALLEQHSVLKSRSVSTSNSEEREDTKQNAGVSAHGVEEVETETQLTDSTNLKSRKQVDRSSCGSNTPSSSEVEADALHEKGKEDQEFDINHQSNDVNTRRGRIFSNINDSWKEVSEEGRVAFQALFSRDILPQSFYSCQGLKNKGHKISEGMQPASNDDVRLQQNDQQIIYGGCSINQPFKGIPPLMGENNKQEELPTLRIVHANLKTRRTGFKPYKRCSIEAKDGRAANCNSRDGEKCPKRTRVEGESALTSYIGNSCNL